MEDCRHEICGEFTGHQKSLQFMGPNALRRWLNDGEVSAPADGENVNLYGKVAILIAGKASAYQAEPISAPAHVDLAEATFSENAKVFIRNA